MLLRHRRVKQDADRAMSATNTAANLALRSLMATLNASDGIAADGREFEERCVIG